MKKLYTLILFLILFGTASQSQTQVTFYTGMGTFVVETYDTLMPITAGNFLDLVTSGFYDNVQFHRVVANFVIQGGDPTGTGYGGPGYTIPDEFHPLTSNVKKALGMANSGPNTGGSQFFINLKNNTYLNPNYPCFGIVISNFEVVEAIGAVAVNANNHPLVNVYMDSLRVTYWSPTAIQETVKPLQNLKIFPNPVSSASHIQLNINTGLDVEITLFNQQGIRLNQVMKSLPSGFNTFSLYELGARDLPAGLYFVTIRSGDFAISRKFVVQD